MDSIGIRIHIQKKKNDKTSEQSLMLVWTNLVYNALQELCRQMCEGRRIVQIRYNRQFDISLKEKMDGEKKERVTMCIHAKVGQMQEKGNFVRAGLGLAEVAAWESAAVEGTTIGALYPTSLVQLALGACAWAGHGWAARGRSTGRATLWRLNIPKPMTSWCIWQFVQWWSSCHPLLDHCYWAPC